MIYSISDITMFKMSYFKFFRRNKQGWESSEDSRNSEAFGHYEIGKFV